MLKKRLSCGETVQAQTQKNNPLQKTNTAQI